MILGLRDVVLRTRAEGVGLSWPRRSPYVRAGQSPAETVSTLRDILQVQVKFLFSWVPKASVDTILTAMTELGMNELDGEMDFFPPCRPNGKTV